MSSILSRIFKISRQKINKGLDKYEDNIENLREQREKIFNDLKAIKDELTELKAKRKIQENALETKKKLKDDLLQVAKKQYAIDKEKYASVIKEAYEGIAVVNEEIKMYESTIAKYSELIEKVESKIDLAEKQLKTYDFQLCKLEVKKKFTDVTNDIIESNERMNSVISDISFNKNQDVEKIELNYEMAEIKLSEEDSGVSELDKLLKETENDQDFENFLKSLEEEKANESED